MTTYIVELWNNLLKASDIYGKGNRGLSIVATHKARDHAYSCAAMLHFLHIQGPVLYIAREGMAQIIQSNIIQATFLI